MKNPLRIFENFNECFKNDYLFEYYFFKIMNLFITRYKWEGIPDVIPQRFIEEVLFWRGSGVFIYDDFIKEFAFMKLNLNGMPDIYDIPKNRIAYASNGYVEEYGKYNSCILFDNPTRFPFCYTAKIYANSLANAWRTKELNMFAQRTPIVFACPDEQRLTYQILGENYGNYVPILKVNDTVDLDRIKVLKTDAPYIVDKIELEMREIFSQLLTDLGYESNPIEKRERVTRGETCGNNGETEGQRNVGLTLREECCRHLNTLWGWNASVVFRSDLPTMVNGKIYTKQEGIESE